MKKILFLTGTRADYGKIKSLMNEVEKSKQFELYIFVTGMHMLSKYGSTYREIEKDGFKNIYYFINQQSVAKMDLTLSNTILGLSNFVHEIKPDLIVVHGDRLEALAGAIVGSFNNIRVAHIEGGEVSGTIDESIRHAITKFAHIHLVSNEKAKQRVIQLGEKEEDIYVIGSPDIDIMLSNDLPTIEVVKQRYEIPFNDYAILLYHPVTTEVESLKGNVSKIVNAVIRSEKNYVVIYPNNDEGNNHIFNEYKRFKNKNNFKIYPSMRFEYFLTLLKYSSFIIGNSSAGVREAEIYGVPAIDIGNRQKGRYNSESNPNIIHVNEDEDSILKAISLIKDKQTCYKNFGTGESHIKFRNLLEYKIWNGDIQKHFVDSF